MQFIVFGNPIEHSLSPLIHADFGRQIGVNLQYSRSLTSSAQFNRAVAEFFRTGGGGANVTVPFKQHAYAQVTHVSARAERAGAVNTLVPLGAGQLLGDNTDGLGLVWDLQRLLGASQLTGKRVLLLGAGGAARGVIQPLLDAGVTTITVINRSPERAQQLVQLWQSPQLVWAPAATPEYDLIVNATSASLSGDKLVLGADVLDAAELVYDMMYGAKPSPFLEQAGQYTQMTADGLGMLVGQAGFAFKLWLDGAELNLNETLERLRAELNRGT
ncbi:shikimate dehydrogenase [Pseudidiomarina taiwanensis]|nr:shikimate dehydrogenase [Pseudidiomarina taiwanensis]